VQLARQRTCGILPRVSITRPFSQLSIRQRDALALLLILAVAAIYRFWQLTRVPPGLFGDEAVNGLDALDALAGRASLFYPANYGREGLAMLLFAGGIQLWGPTALALRIPAALAGIATALATYWLGRELLADTRYRGVLVPLLAALLLSTSFWHVYTSRYAERLIFTPLLAALAFAAFWRAANATQRMGARAAWPWFLLSGLFLGLSVHFYSISRLFPVFLGIYLLLQVGYLWLARRTQAADHLADPGQSLLRRAFWPLMGLYGVALLVFAPLGLYFLRHPGSFTQRADVVSAFAPGLSGSETLALIVQAGTANLLQFFAPGAGDSAPFFNLPGRAVFDPLTAAAALAGLILCLALTLAGLQRRRSAVSARQGARLLFLLLWFLVMLLPGWLAVDRFPALPRVMGVIPGVYFFPALALGELFLWARGRSESQRPAARLAPWLAIGLAAFVLVVHGGLTWRDYFQRWAHAADTFDAFEGDIAAAAGWLASHPGHEVFLSADLYRHPSFVYLHQQAPLSQFFAYVDPQVHFFDGRATLPLPPAGSQALYLFTANAGPDPILARVPGWTGLQAVEEDKAGGAGLAVYRLNSDAVDRSQFQPADSAFAAGPRLTGYRVQPLADGAAAVLLLWEMDEPQPGRYQGLQVQLGWLPPGGGQQLAQASGELAYRPTEWAPGSAALSWLVLPQPAELPEDVTLAVRVVDLADGQPLAVAGSDAAGWLSLPLR
jgi:4-amino-4-deoxy-L-arabinose transferase-like glycosyltransferase